MSKINKTILFAPLEEVLFTKGQDYREASVKNYKDLIEVGSTLGSDYSVFREYLGVECIAAVLHDYSYYTDIFIPSNYRMKEDEVINYILHANADVLAVSILYDLQLVNAINVAKIVKQKIPEIIIIFGGAFVTVDANDLFHIFDFIDFILVGEGEKSIIELYRAIENNHTMEHIQGLYYRDNGGIKNNPIRELLDLNSLSVPVRDVIGNMVRDNTPVNTAYLYSSRGCYGTCTFCSVPNINKPYNVKWRYRDPILLVDEIEDVVNNYNVRFIYFTDDNFYGYPPDNEKRLLLFAEEIIRRKLKIEFHAECRVDKLNEQVLVKLQKAGLTQILFGIESGCDRTLRRWGKHQTVKDNEYAIQVVKKLHFEYIPSIILLDWQSDIFEVKDTVDFIGRNKLYEIKYPLSLVNKMHILKGTEAEKIYLEHHPNRKDKILKKDYSNLKEWAIQHTYQDIEIEDIYTDAFWKYLSKVVNEWYVISQEIIPSFMIKYRKNRKKMSQSSDLIIRCRKWRRGLGLELYLLMKILVSELIKLYEQKEEDFNLEALINNFFTTSMSKYFPDGLYDELEVNFSR